jgi:hypothetical protein
VRRLRAVAAGLVLALALSGCAARGASLGTTSSPCFHALPAAAEAVGHQGRFLGVRLVPVDRLRRRVPDTSVLGKIKVCVVAYKGNYTTAEVSHPLDALPGPYAIVVVKTNGSAVLGTVVLRRLPLVFRHTF